MNPILQGIIVGCLVGCVVAAITYALGRRGRNQDRKTDEVLRKETIAIEAVKERDARILQLEKDVQNLQSQAEAAHKAAIPITAAMEAMLISKLVNNHTPEADALLKKHTDNTLTPADAVEFARLLKERETDSDPRIGRAQQIAAEMLPLTIELKKLDEETAGQTATTTVMVTVPATETVPAGDGGTQEEEKGN